MTQPSDHETTTTKDSNDPKRDAASGRARTRTRARAEPTSSRERRPAHGDGDDAQGRASAASSDGDTQTGDGDKEAGAQPRRRRRGRRGRGGGRGQGGQRQGGGRQKADGSVEPGERDDAAAGRRDGSRGGSRGGRRSGQGRDREGPRRDAAEQGGDDPVEDQRDREVRETIAKSGTRAAAKRGSGGGRAGGGRRAQRPGGVPEEVRRAILEGPPRTMLVTSKQDRTQIAVLEDRTVVEHYVTRTDDVTLVGNIYMARVQNVLPGMEAAFLDIGTGRNGVLYAGEVLYDELDLEEGAAERIENVLKPGQQVLVQVTKDPMGSKGPRLTMHLSLAGRFMVLAPDSDLFGISRKLTDKERDRLRRVVKAVKPERHGVIVRTAAEGATEQQITADVERLLAKWQKVEERAETAKVLTPVYEEPPLVVKVIRDNFGPEFERCTVDSEGLYHQVRDYLAEVAEELLDKVELYGAPTTDARARAAGAPASAAVDEATAEPDTAPQPDADAGGDVEAATGSGGEQADEPVDLAAAAERREKLPALFDAYDVTEQLRKALNTKVWLPSGGYLIIETTEAMKVIDVNTGKFTGDADTNLEEVVLKTNLEAADEIVRQLRLRDIGGIIIIDFIDMLLRANQEQVVRRLKRELLRDRTKTRVSDVSQLGLVQMTRKNVSQGLLESFSETCEACGGRGVISEIN